MDQHDRRSLNLRTLISIGHEEKLLEAVRTFESESTDGKSRGPLTWYYPEGQSKVIGHHMMILITVASKCGLTPQVHVARQNIAKGLAGTRRLVQSQ